MKHTPSIPKYLSYLTFTPTLITLFIKKIKIVKKLNIKKMNGQIWYKSQMRQHLHLEMNGVIQKINGGNNLETDGVLLTSLNIRRFDFFYQL
jgi:hypothetical protein